MDDADVFLKRPPHRFWLWQIYPFGVDCPACPDDERAYGPRRRSRAQPRRPRQAELDEKVFSRWSSLSGDHGGIC